MWWCGVSAGAPAPRPLSQVRAGSLPRKATTRGCPVSFYSYAPRSAKLHCQSVRGAVAPAHDSSGTDQPAHDLSGTDQPVHDSSGTHQALGRLLAAPCGLTSPPPDRNFPATPLVSALRPCAKVQFSRPEGRFLRAALNTHRSSSHPDVR